MDYSQDTPFKSFEEIKNAVKAHKVSFSWRRGSAYNLVCESYKMMILSNLMIPLFSLLFMLISCQVLSVSKWIALLTLIVLPLNMVISNRLNGLFMCIALIFIVVPLWVINSVLWLVPIGAGIIGMMVGDYIWWGLTSGIATNLILTGEFLFMDEWSKRGFAIRDRDANGKLYIFGFGTLDDANN